jgi:hypothetical protein
VFSVAASRLSGILTTDTTWNERFAYHRERMLQARFHASVDTVLSVARDLGRFVAIACHSHAQLAAENLWVANSQSCPMNTRTKSHSVTRRGETRVAHRWRIARG